MIVLMKAISRRACDRRRHTVTGEWWQNDEVLCEILTPSREAMKAADNRVSQTEIILLGSPRSAIGVNHQQCERERRDLGGFVGSS